MAIGDVKATIRRGNQSLNDAEKSVEMASAQLRDASALAIATLHDSQREEAEDARQTLLAAAREVELTLRRINAAREHADAYLGAIG
ncbi:hypothetical protein QQG74_06915 [Micromonospora sp. FIMYZ51]|uniref:hypothetical protein n=1 Tax=Micromonospora sp. FIMYZ51 TaxID=3051832 RepID=UPI00311E6928